MNAVERLVLFQTLARIWIRLNSKPADGFVGR